jgi:hypothetical protein
MASTVAKAEIRIGYQPASDRKTLPAPEEGSEGDKDSVIVFFENVNSESVYLAGDDDSGTEFNT